LLNKIAAEKNKASLKLIGSFSGCDDAFDLQDYKNAKTLYAGICYTAKRHYPKEQIAEINKILIIKAKCNDSYSKPDSRC